MARKEASGDVLFLSARVGTELRFHKVTFSTGEIAEPFTFESIWDFACWMVLPHLKTSNERSSSSL